MNKYDEIINLPHHTSLNHSKMPNTDRAAQFAPFSALTGYESLIKEIARITSSRIDLTSDKIEEINKKLSFLKQHLKSGYFVKITYFEKDDKKEGGIYQEIKGYIKTINEYHKYIKINDIVIRFEDIYSVESDIFDSLIFS